MTLQRCWAEWTRWWIMGGESGVCNIISTSIAIIEWWGRQMHIYSHQSLLRQFRPLLWNKSLEAPLAELSCGKSVLLRSKQDIIDARTSALPVRILITSTCFPRRAKLLRRRAGQREPKDRSHTAVPDETTSIISFNQINFTKYNKS